MTNIDKFEGRLYQTLLIGDAIEKYTTHNVCRGAGTDFHTWLKECYVDHHGRTFHEWYLTHIGYVGGVVNRPGVKHWTEADLEQRARTGNRQ